MMQRSFPFTASLSDRPLDTSARPAPASFTPGVEGFSYRDLRDLRALPRLTAAFDAFAAPLVGDAAWAAFTRYRATKGDGLSPEEVSDVLVKTAPAVAAFLAKLFGVEGGRAALGADVAREDVVFEFKRDFVKKRTAKRKRAEVDALDAAARTSLDAAARAVLSAATGLPDHWNDEREVALAVLPLVRAEELFRQSLARGGVAATADDLARARALADALRGALGDALPAEVTDDAAGAKVYAAALDVIDRWCLLRLVDHAYDHHWVSLRLPKLLDPQNLVPLRRPNVHLPEAMVGAHERRERDGFALTDRRQPLRRVQDEVEYCIYCHDRDKDSCSKGLRAKDGSLKPNGLGIPLAGCPLDEKISEAHYLKRTGDSIASLAVVMVDNPMLPGTGHRICNDCMKACIYQKQEPVNIPLIETSILTDVLGLRWGFEVYDLLTRWNPLRVEQPEQRPYNGRNVLVVGLGPAGYTLTHWLSNEGFGTVGVDGLKIEPLPPHLVEGPVEDFKSLYVELDERVLLGFGGVSEYGITVRWDKNFLTVVYLVLARRENLAIHGGVRFGGTLDLDDAWAMGFDHVALASGAGKPTLIDIPNGLIRGVRQASDFLMALQLTGAYKKTSLANLPVRLPAVVIGGGLTAIDTATELRAYYVVQVEKVLERHETLCRELGEAPVRERLSPEERGQLDEALAHGRAVREERARAAAEGRAPRFNALLDAWGGVTIAYRRTLVESPAYRLNHEEVEQCFAEGVVIAERLSPKEFLADDYGAVRAAVFDRMEVRDGKLVATGLTTELPARTVCIAAGTSPNVTFERERPGSFEMDPKTRAFRPHRAVLGGDGEPRVEPDPKGFFTSYVGPKGELVSYYGDNHPVYAGSVVKAMASAKDGYPFVSAVFRADIDAARAGEREGAWPAFRAKVAGELDAVVHEVKRLTPTIVEVIVRAPLAARKFQPGQFYRLQNFEMLAPMVEGSRLVMEGLALTGAWTDPDKGLLSMIGLEMGASSRLMALLRPGEPVVVMGPTGAPTEIPKDEHVILAGGGLGNAVLFSIGKALRANGCKVIYFAGYRDPNDLFRMEDIEASADQVVWASDKGPAIKPRRLQDLSFVGNIVQAMHAYASGNLGVRKVALEDCSRIIAIGSDRMMAAVQAARYAILKDNLKPGHVAIGSINSPMQCMMKEICAQCLQRHVDPATGKASIVFTCFNQDQDLDRVDFPFLNMRLKQAAMQESIADLWLRRLLALYDGPRV
jgi:NADPH-dependent glutamate synthase beta subunit-like oxidoreductase/NAD(P)H-flavin reductase